MTFAAAKGWCLVLHQDIIVQVSENVLLLKKDILDMSIDQILLEPSMEDFRNEQELTPKVQGTDVHLFEVVLDLDKPQRFFCAAHFHHDFLVLELDRWVPLEGNITENTLKYNIGSRLKSSHVMSLSTMGLLRPLEVTAILETLEVALYNYKTTSDMIYFMLRSIRAITNFDGSLACQFDRNFNATMLGEDSEGDFNLYRAMSFNSRTRARLTSEATKALMANSVRNMPCYIIYDRDADENRIIPDMDNGVQCLMLKSVATSLMNKDMLREIKSRSLIRMALVCHNAFWGVLSFHSQQHCLDFPITVIPILNKIARIFGFAIERVKAIEGQKASDAISAQFLQESTTERSQSPLGFEKDETTFTTLERLSRRVLSLLSSTIFILQVGKQVRIYSISHVDTTLYQELSKIICNAKIRSIYSSIFVPADPVLNLSLEMSQVLAGLLYIPINVELDTFVVFLRPGNPELSYPDAPDWTYVEMNLARLVERTFSEFFDMKLQQVVAANAVEKDRELMSSISHAVRTPLNAVMNFVELSLYDDFPKDALSTLELAYESSHSLLSILEDILSLTFVSSNRKMTMNCKPFLVYNVIRSIFAVYTAQPKVPLKTECPASLEPIVLEGDVPKLSQILINLLNNAFKYTLSGNVDCKISYKIQNHNCLLTIQVTDTGIGIPTEYLSRIFEEFERIESTHPLRAEREGLGLGLSIVHRLVKLMNGSISVKSQVDKGSSFTVMLPFPVINASATVDLSPRIHVHMNLLLAEDNVVNQRVMTKRLEKLGYTVQVASNGKECVDIYIKAPNQYNAILMDIMMPVCDGIEATRLIRNFERQSQIPKVSIIAVSANVSPAEIERYHAEGFDSCFGKPVDFAKLDNYLYSKKSPASTSLDTKLALFD
ncbi:hypothetical protein EDD86DRAFT_272438 [Gorgonomyces haynaldii]|nr:hypothetical protein EDD86DRAFT_272438 [Gorgonomyces haynaldii]